MKTLVLATVHADFWAPATPPGKGGQFFHINMVTFLINVYDLHTSTVLAAIVAPSPGCSPKQFSLM